MSMPPREPEPTGLTRGPWRWGLLLLGGLLVVLAVAGALLPVLPTTPFLLLAGACFARASPRLHARLRRAPLFGAYVDQWERDRSIPAPAKRRAYVLVALAFGFSIWMVEATWQRALLALIGVALVVFLGRLPTTAAGEGC